MKSKKRTGWKYVLSLIIIILFIVPMYVLLVMSFKEPTDFSSRLVPASYIYFGNYKAVFAKGSLLRGVLNSVFITVVCVAIEVVVGSLAAYGLARNKSRLSKFVSTLFMSIMMIPPLSVLVGIYTEMVAFKAISTYWGIIAVTVAFGLPMSIFLYSKFIVSIPLALDEASVIDGANTFQTFWHIILPELKPVTISVVILKGVGVWNDYLYPTYILQNSKMFTSVLAVKQYFSESSNNLTEAAAAAILGMLPIVICYLILQKQFIQSQVDSAIK